MRNRIFILLLVITLNAFSSAFAQTTEFVYQGKLINGGSPASGNHDFEFLLFDSLAGGTQIGSTVMVNGVTVTDGTFSVRLNFGAQFPGANRFLEIHVRASGGGAFTPLAPRQQINSAPYSVKSISAETAASATTAATATNALQLGGVAANQYVLTGDPRMSDARNPLPNSPFYIQSPTQNGPPQVAGFNITGDGSVGGILRANQVVSLTHFNIGNSRVLSAPANNTFVGVGTGNSNMTGNFNAFLGFNAGAANTTGTDNSFFGSTSGSANTEGNNNTFFGTSSGRDNTTGDDNTFVGAAAGLSNSTGSFNTLVGRNAGRFNATGQFNTFVGNRSGFSNTTGIDNTFIGDNTGIVNSTASKNTFVGSNAGDETTVGEFNTFIGNLAGHTNTTGASNVFVGQLAGSGNTTGASNTLLGASANVSAGNLNFATAIGAGALVSSNNTVVLGRGVDTVQIPGVLDTGSQYNIGGNRVLSAVGSSNIFVGIGAGAVTTGSFNAFLGQDAGLANTSGSRNAFFGRAAGDTNTAGSDNTFVGHGAGNETQTGGQNVFVGALAGDANTIGNSNTTVGGFSDVGANNLTNATAIGHRALVSQNNSMVLGSITGVNGAIDGTNVGIGTTTPVSRLHIADNSGNIHFGGGGCGSGFTGMGFASALSCSNYSLLGNGTDTMINAPSTGKIFMRIGNSTKASIDANGDVGIGTASPSGRLHVVDGANSMILSSFLCNGVTYTGLRVTPFAGCDGPGMWAANDGFTVVRGGWGLELRAGSAGTAILYSTGGFRVGGDLFVTGEVSLNLGSAGTTSLCRNNQVVISTCSSSIRYKSNVVRFDSGVDLIQKLRPVSFNWKDGGMRDMGLVAEQVAEVEPLLVTHNKDGQIEGVKYDRVGVVLVNAVKEQQQQIDSQTQEISDLKATVEEQRTTIALLKAVVCKANPDEAVCKTRP